MPPKKRPVSETLEQTPKAPASVNKTPKKTPARTPKKTLAKTPKKTPRKTVTVARKKPGPKPKCIIPPPEVKMEEPASPSEEELPTEVRDAFYPFEKIDCDLIDVVKGVKKAVDGVLNDHGLRCVVPIKKMSSIAKRMKDKFGDCPLERLKGKDSFLDGTIDEAFPQIHEEDIGVNMSIFRQELSKYMLIAGSQLDNLSTGTLLSIVQNLHKYRLNTTEYEVGSPIPVASTVNKFFGLTKHEFASVSEQRQLMLNKGYIRERMKYHTEMEVFLNEKHKKLLTLVKGDKYDLFKAQPDLRRQEEELIESFKRSRDTSRFLKMEYERLTSKEEKYCSYRDGFRIISLKGKIGVRSEEEEKKIDKEFINTPFNVMKMFVENWRKANGVEPLPKEKEVRRAPFVTTPAIHIVHEPYPY